MALIYSDEERWAALSDDDRRGAYDRYRDLVRDAEAAGVLAGGNELGPTRNATTVRVRGDESLVTDGPYAEVKEALGGYFVFECASIDDAVDWAARIPGAEHGAVEVRPVHVEPETMRVRSPASGNSRRPMSRTCENRFWASSCMARSTTRCASRDTRGRSRRRDSWRPAAMAPNKDAGVL
jgi:hypothetical protein